VKFAATGSIIGAISTAGIAWKYSRSPHGILVAPFFIQKSHD